LLGLFVAASLGPGEGEPSEAPLAAAPFVPAEMTRAGADVVALLGGLRQGDRIAGANVLAVLAPVERRCSVVVELDGTVFDIGISQKGTSKALPPVVLDKYELVWGGARGAPMKSPDAVSAVTQAVADRVRANENSVPVPAGM